jgi:cytochrome c oxidase subunit 3/cytochrome o ubiquinol oxidase subunit 3
LAQAVATLDQTQGAGLDAGHGHAEHPPTSTGIDHRKMLMWCFLASDCMFFGALIATYLIYRGRTEKLVEAGQGKGPVPHDVLDIPYTSVSAFVLLMSSLTMVLALAAIQKGNYRGLRVWLLATALLGSIFLGGQWFEFTSFYKNKGLGLTTNMFGSTFFTLTGFHGTHVLIGVIMLLSLLFVSLRGGLKQEQAINVEIIGLYWHFVDIVWIIIFTLVYLIPYHPVNVPAGTGGFIHLSRLVGLG